MVGVAQQKFDERGELIDEATREAVGLPHRARSVGLEARKSSA